MITTRLALAAALAALLGGGCIEPDAEGIAPAAHAVTTVKVDLHHQPLPEMPLPNDLGTRFDPGSPTGRRINVSTIASTRLESRMRELIDDLDGWGVFQQITIPFSGPLDVAAIARAHHQKNYDLADDLVYLIDVDRGSPEFGRVHRLDAGNGNYPVVLESMDKYWKNDPRAWTISMLYEEADEDTNGNGVLDPGEDTDADGVLDRPNYFPGRKPARDDLAGRADALTYYYERETNTLILRPLEPLRERTTYAVVVTRRLKDEAGRPVGSPYPWVNHASQTAALKPVLEVLPAGLSRDDIAFAFSFTTQSTDSHLRAVRDGLYGHGVQAHLGREFPAELAGLEQLRDPQYFPKAKNLHLAHTEELLPLAKPLAAQLLGLGDDSEAQRVFLEAARYVDYHVIGSFRSPQLFPRTRSVARADAKPGEEGGACLTDRTCKAGLSCWNGSGTPAWFCARMLPLDDQSWPRDLDRAPAQARGETVYFWLTVPRKEISARGQGKPAPVVVLSHGYTSSRTEVLGFGGLLARAGFAAIGIDCVSHGLGIGVKEEAVARALLQGKGLDGFLEAVLKSRAFDQNNDGVKDPGADFWTAHAFHTRDMVRQSALDYMQLVRILRSFDGVRRGKIDLDGDGQPELAGDFDGDGVVDLGGDAPIGMIGGSLGGIMSLYVGSTEPGVSMIAPISGGAGLPDVGIRSRQGGVPEAFYLRVMGPLYVGTLDPKSGELKVETTVPDLNRAPSHILATVKGVLPGDPMVVENLNNRKRGCGYVSAAGTVRAALESDFEDPTRIVFYVGDALGGEECALRSDARPRLTISTFERDVIFQGKIYSLGQPLVALAQGLGLRRATPALRRFISFAQPVIDPGDPASYLRHLSRERLTYPGTGQRTGAHALIITTVGDMNVPASSGVTAGRAAGLIDYLHDDPRYGKPENQVLIDTYNVEAVNTLKRYKGPGGEGVHLDVDNLSAGADMWGTTLPRLSPPLRCGWGKDDGLGGVSAALFPISDPGGTHAFDLPGMMTDRVRKACKKECKETGGDDPCGCKTKPAWDIGLFMFNLMGRYFVSGGKTLSDDACMGYDACPDKLKAPSERDPSTLR
jgi:hypothetical protein